MSLVPVIKWAKNLERDASFVNKERLTEASLTKHSNAWKDNLDRTLKKQLNEQEKKIYILYFTGWDTFLISEKAGQHDQCYDNPPLCNNI